MYVEVPNVHEPGPYSHAVVTSGLLDSVIKLTIFVVGLLPAHRSIIGAELKRRFPGTPPANSLIGVSALARTGLLIEIEAVATTS